MDLFRRWLLTLDEGVVSLSDLAAHASALRSDVTTLCGEALRLLHSTETLITAPELLVRP